MTRGTDGASTESTWASRIHPLATSNLLLLLGCDAQSSVQQSGDTEDCIAPIALTVQIAPRHCTSNSDTAHALIYARHRSLHLGTFVENNTTS